jgi:hypothetical protein
MVDELWRPQILRSWQGPFGGQISVDPTPCFDPGGEFPDAIGWKVTIPERYAAGNPVTMRMYLFHSGSFDPNYFDPNSLDCQVFRMAVARLVDGGSIDVQDNIYVRIDIPDGLPYNPMLVVDLPINTSDGLNLFTADLATKDLLGFGMQWYDNECRVDEGEDWCVLGVDFFESETTAIDGITILPDPNDCYCP